MHYRGRIPKILDPPPKKNPLKKKQGLKNNCFLFLPPKHLGKNWTLHSHPPRCRKRRAAVWCTAGKAPAAPFGSPRWFSLRRGQTPMILLILLGDVGFFLKKGNGSKKRMLWIWWGVRCVGFLWEIRATGIRKNPKKNWFKFDFPTVLEIKAMGNNSPVEGATHGMFCSQGGGLSTFCWAVSAPNPYDPRNLRNDPSWRAFFCLRFPHINIKPVWWWPVSLGVLPWIFLIHPWWKSLHFSNFPAI